MARILVADDDQFTREMAQRALQTDGHTVVMAADGSEALALFGSEPTFDLIITDVDMPNVSGLELTEAVIAQNAAQRIIIMSGLADELVRARALLSPTVRMITKPVTLEQIRGEAAEMLG